MLALALLVLTGTADDLPTRIVGGTDAALGDWPSAGAVLIDGGMQCTAVLVHPRVVMTAGHCDWDDLTEAIVNTVDGETGERIPIESTHRHPNHFTTLDVSAVVLQTPATTEPVTIARECIRDVYLVNGATVHLVGFGATDREAATLPDTLQHAVSLLVDHDCDDPDRGCNEAVSPGGELIAGGAGIDSCTGDSGGPLYLQTDQGIFLAGITSRAALPMSAPCGDGGIYVRADAFVDWVESETGFTLPEPDCTGFDNSAPQPTAEPIVTQVNEPGHTQIEPNDPDAGDTHAFAIGEQPRNGVALTGPSGDVAYLPDPDFVGEDRFTVRITDDGVPSATVEIEIPVEVHWTEPTDTGDSGEEPRGGRCGCANSGGLAGWWGLLLAVGLRRRGKSIALGPHPIKPYR